MNNQGMIDFLVEEGSLKSPRIIRAFEQVDRSLFAPHDPYLNTALSLFKGQTISQPSMVAIMLEKLEPQSQDQVLEIGAGSGYMAALLGTLTKQVTSLEIEPELLNLATTNLKKTPLMNVKVLPWSQSNLSNKKFSKVLFSCGVKQIPVWATDHLTTPGILVAPVGSRERQELTILKKQKTGIVQEKSVPCVFVMFRSERI